MANFLRGSLDSSRPLRAGVGFKPQHYAAIIDSVPDIGFFEIHAENYMGAGGPPHRFLSEIRDRYPLSIHGVGLSPGAARSLDRAHLKRLKALVTRYEPALVSEHLAWSAHDWGFLNDLLPLPYTQECLTITADHIDEIQERLGRQILIENPSTYLAFDESTQTEAEFICDLVKRTGCGLLLDVNNVYVSCMNQRSDPLDYFGAYPFGAVGEIHLAGHACETDEHGQALLIDTHDRCVPAVVRDLLMQVLPSIGRVPILIEWDKHIPAWPILESEAANANRALDSVFAHQQTDQVLP
jgi:uncharacterized protein